MTEEQYDKSETELLEDFYSEAREGFRMMMKAEGVDEETIESAIKTVNDNL